MRNCILFFVCCISGFPITQAEEGTILEGKDVFREPPITVECRVSLPDSKAFNILVASDTKASGDHWELFTTPGAGLLTAYLPGYSPDHVRSKVGICDGKPHTIGMTYEQSQVRLFVDGQQVASQQIQKTKRESVPGALAIGRLVEGNLQCSGSIQWVRISKGVRKRITGPTDSVEQEADTLLLWSSSTQATNGQHSHTAGMQRNPSSGFQTPEYSNEVVSELVEQSRLHGDSHHGLAIFASSKSACLSCHRIGNHGGHVGPELTKIGSQRKPEQIVTSILWPNREVEAKYVAHAVIDISGKTRQGYIVREDNSQVVLQGISDESAKEIVIPTDTIELRREIGTVMPGNLAATMTESDLMDLISLMSTLGTEQSLPIETIDAILSHTHSHAHGPADFAYDRRPLQPEYRPGWQHHVNRDRIYDFYAKQADHFRQQSPAPSLIVDYPGLDGGSLGHWGNQNDEVWADDRWNQVDMGSLISGVFRSRSVIPRAVCVRFGDDGQMATCFDPDTLNYTDVWQDGFVQFSDHRHGFLAGLKPDGKMLDQRPREKPGKPFEYHGFYRIGQRVAFSYSVGEQKFLDAPTVRDGSFERLIAEAEQHPWNDDIQNPPRQWPQTFQTPITLGQQSSYTIDRIKLPTDNPWNALLFCGDHAFLPDGSALVCTMHGDVWKVSDFAYPSKQATWQRFASGLHHPLGMVIDDDGIFVLCRDQITRLHDLNNDGEADFYECFSNAFQTSPAGHDFICGLARDADGYFYLSSGNQGLVRISPDGKVADVMATGFRNPDGLGMLPEGIVTVPCSEGSWTPASMICAVRVNDQRRKQFYGNEIPHFGHRGPRGGQAPELPLVYLPRGLDNSSGGQTVVHGNKWGPLDGQLVHFSFGKGSHFLVLRDEVDGQMQGAVVPLPGEFRSGAHRGKFHPVDGQLYVTGMQGWGSYTPDDGSFERVRYTGDVVQLPTQFRVHENGVAVTFSEELNEDIVTDAGGHFAQVWNYRYGPGYGSPEMSTRHEGMRGHDVLRITKAHLLPDRRTLFLELPEIQPVNQLHLRLRTAAEEFQDLFVTVHRLAEPMTEIPGYRATRKSIAPHPIVADLARATRSVPNPHLNRIKNARAVRIETGSNLTFQTKSFTVQAGEAVALTLSNPDVVPHNWALVKSGTLDQVGPLADRLISDPEASLRHYVPSTPGVLAYTNVVLPREEVTIYFNAPKQPGRYPYLCTFPGHWKIMNGTMIVEPGEN